MNRTSKAATIKVPKVYDHSTKAGNRGDVWKHAILLSVVYQMIERERAKLTSSIFRYFETHAGQGVYMMPNEATGERAFEKFRCFEPSPYPLYRGLMPKTPRMYFGSWMLVKRLMVEAGYICQMTLCETDQVAGSIANDFTDGRDTLRLANGWEVLGSHHQPRHNLVFMDPAYTTDHDWANATLLFSRCEAGNFPCILWYDKDQSQKHQAMGNALHKSLGATIWEVGWKGGGAGMILSRDLPAPRCDMPMLAESIGGTFNKQVAESTQLWERGNS